jgi:hypothetical protein
VHDIGDREKDQAPMAAGWHRVKKLAEDSGGSVCVELS